MERRRTKYDIYADSIEIITKKGLCSLTRVSYGANMPVDRTKKVLKVLASHGFVKEVVVGERRKYRATKRGLEYLETFRRIQRFFAALEEPVKIRTRTPEIELPGRIPTGFDQLDTLLFGGIPENYAVLLTSPSCDERDVIIKRFLEAGTKGEHTTFFITPETANVKALAQESQQNFYLFLCNPRADAIVEDSKNTFKLKGVDNLTEIGIALNSAFRRLDRSRGEQRRACIEILSDVLLQHHAANTRRWMSGVLPELRSRKFTTLAVLNPYMHPPEEVQAILGLFEGEINIYEKESEKGSEKFLKIKKLYNQRYSDQKMTLKRED